MRGGVGLYGRPRGGEVIVFPQDVTERNRTRATIKAHTAQPNPARPYGWGGLVQLARALATAISAQQMLFFVHALDFYMQFIALEGIGSRRVGRRVPFKRDLLALDGHISQYFIQAALARHIHLHTLLIHFHTLGDSFE